MYEKTEEMLDEETRRKDYTVAVLMDYFNAVVCEGKDEEYVGHSWLEQ